MNNSLPSCHGDLLALHVAAGSSVGQFGYMPEADLNLDGHIDLDDYALLRIIGCPADFNCDGVVDDVDFLDFGDAYNEYVSLDGDFNGDGITDDVDWGYFTVAYNAFECPSHNLFEVP